jgi:Secretion system C-terminal sorting domain
MLKGSPSAGMILADLPLQPSFAGDNNSLFAAPKVLDCDASALPPYGTPDFLVFYQNIASGGASNSIIMDSLIVDTSAHTFRVAEADSFAVPTFNGYFSNGNETDISQPGLANGVDALDGTFNFRVPYMRFTGYNSVVLSNTVNLGSSVAGIRWYELRQNDTTGVWSLHDTGTYGPADGISRWNGAICQDYDGNIALAYSASSSTVYPGIRYTGRLATDPIGQMTFAEQTAIAGTKSLTGTFGRWGDYSELDIDPSDGLTFWCTNQYGADPNGYTQYNRIFSFKLEGTTGIDELQNQAVLKVYQNGNFLDVKATGLPGNDIMTVNLFDVAGRQLTTQSVTPAANMFETQINVSALPKGVYFVRMGRASFQRVVKTLIN